MSLEVAEAAARRLERASDDDSDRALMMLLANYQAVTADPRKMGYLRSLLKHYAKSPTPWRDCYKDNLKRFGSKTPALCGVLKDLLRQRTDWRGKGPNPHDHGSPGVDIAESDKGDAPAWGGHHGLKLDVPSIPDEIWAVLEDVTRNCDPCRVLLGLDEAPHPSADVLALAATP
jgi:hypothetical protein